MAKAYHIVQWDTANETSESRKYQALHWFAKSNKFHGLGFNKLRLHPERVELYCGWTLLEALASQGPKFKRGWLMRDGRPLSVDDMAFLSGFPRSIFELALEYFSGAEMGWLELREIPEDSSGGSAGGGNGLRQEYLPEDSSGGSAGGGRKSATDRQTVTDRQTTLKKEKEEKGWSELSAAEQESARQQQKQQFAAVGARIAELEAIADDERTGDEREELKKTRRTRKEIQRRQRSGDFRPVIA